MPILSLISILVSPSEVTILFCRGQSANSVTWQLASNESSIFTNLFISYIKLHHNLPKDLNYYSLKLHYLLDAHCSHFKHKILLIIWVGFCIIYFWITRMIWYFTRTSSKKIVSWIVLLQFAHHQIYYHDLLQVY